MEQDFLGWLAKTDPEKLKKAERAARIVQLGACRRKAAAAKLEGALKWVDDLPEKEKKDE